MGAAFFHPTRKRPKAAADAPDDLTQVNSRETFKNTRRLTWSFRNDAKQCLLAWQGNARDEVLYEIRHNYYRGSAADGSLDDRNGTRRRSRCWRRWERRR